jgi:hypothetical protein
LHAAAASKLHSICAEHRQQLSQHIKQKGLRATLAKAWKHYVFSHQELLWMERDLVSPVPPHSLKPYPPLRVVTITADNASAFARYFGDRVGTMAELANEGHTGLMHLDEQGDAVGLSGAAHGTISTGTTTVACSR